VANMPLAPPLALCARHHAAVAPFTSSVREVDGHDEAPRTLLERGRVQPEHPTVVAGQHVAMLFVRVGRELR
jgi:hypothetical protein